MKRKSKSFPSISFSYFPKTSMSSKQSRCLFKSFQHLLTLSFTLLNLLTVLLSSILLLLLLLLKLHQNHSSSLLLLSNLLKKFTLILLRSLILCLTTSLLHSFVFSYSTFNLYFVLLFFSQFFLLGLMMISHFSLSVIINLVQQVQSCLFSLFPILLLFLFLLYSFDFNQSVKLPFIRS